MRGSFPPPQLEFVSAKLVRLRCRWAIAGGWGLDLFLGRVRRPHGDVDVAIFRDDQPALRDALPSWTFYLVSDRRLTAWTDGDQVPPAVHQLHAVAPDGTRLELLLSDRSGEDWVYRRDPRIRRPLASALLSASGLPVLAPEIVLLFKSKAPRAVDRGDFADAAPSLDASQARWLRDALELTAPGHEWIGYLEARG